MENSEIEDLNEAATSAGVSLRSGNLHQWRSTEVRWLLIENYTNSMHFMQFLEVSFDTLHV